MFKGAFSKRWLTQELYAPGTLLAPVLCLGLLWVPPYRPSSDKAASKLRDSCGCAVGKAYGQRQCRRDSHPRKEATLCRSNESNSPTDAVEGNQFEDILEYKDRSFQVQDWGKTRDSHQLFALRCMVQKAGWVSVTHPVLCDCPVFARNNMKRHKELSSDGQAHWDSPGKH